ncbi:hypothetical protein EG835_03315 [bacterium]|nr:hypothetical protein [bacterium]
MGCDPIYLLGLDSDWAAKPDLDRHFYNEATIDSDIEEHTPHLPYQELLECTLALWKGYTNIREYAGAAGIEIYNCATGGLLDVYPRRRLQDVLDGS